MNETLIPKATLGRRPTSDKKTLVIKNNKELPSFQDHLTLHILEGIWQDVYVALNKIEIVYRDKQNKDHKFFVDYSIIQNPLKSETESEEFKSAICNIVVDMMKRGKEEGVTTNYFGL